VPAGAAGAPRGIPAEPRQPRLDLTLLDGTDTALKRRISAISGWAGSFGAVLATHEGKEGDEACLDRRGLTACQGRLPDRLAELGADLVAVGVVDLAEDPQGFAPGPVGGRGVARAVVDVTEAAERIGLVEPVGEVTGQRDGPLVACDRFGVVATLMVGVAEAVPDGPSQR
jgi:hypothetical protein